MITFHCISGLGADGRAFQKLSIPGVSFKYVPWPYFDKHDEMACNAQKVAALIPQGPDDHILGLSLGGMLASEIAITRPDQKVIIVSSARTPDELPELHGALEFIGRHKLILPKLGFLVAGKMSEILGAQTKEEADVIKAMMMDVDGHFIRCAAKAILEWQQRTPSPASIIHIHGTSDRVIPPQRVHPTHWVKGGQHMMIYSRAQEVSGLIAQHL
jgi:pimeloyl-ACP methyl ester carboxylesterase